MSLLDITYIHLGVNLMLWQGLECVVEGLGLGFDNLKWLYITGIELNASATLLNTEV